MPGSEKAAGQQKSLPPSPQAGTTTNNDKEAPHRILTHFPVAWTLELSTAQKEAR